MGLQGGLVGKSSWRKSHSSKVLLHPGQVLKAQQPCGTGRAGLASVTGPEVEGSDGLHLVMPGLELWLLFQPACRPRAEHLHQKGPRPGMPAQVMGACQPPAHGHSEADTPPPVTPSSPGESSVSQLSGGWNWSDTQDGTLALPVSLPSSH